MRISPPVASSSTRCGCYGTISLSTSAITGPTKTILSPIRSDACSSLYRPCQTRGFALSLSHRADHRPGTTGRRGLCGYPSRRHWTEASLVSPSYRPCPHDLELARGAMGTTGWETRLRRGGLSPRSARRLSLPPRTAVVETGDDRALPATHGLRADAILASTDHEAARLARLGWNDQTDTIGCALLDSRLSVETMGRCSVDLYRKVIDTRYAHYLTPEDNEVIGSLLHAAIDREPSAQISSERLEPPPCPSTPTTGAVSAFGRRMRT